jgi:hypothetical protein
MYNYVVMVLFWNVYEKMLEANLTSVGLIS